VDEKESFEVAHKVFIPDNTFAIFVHCDAENETLQVDVGDFVSENLVGTREYDAMGLIISELSTSIEEAMQRFAAIDPDFDIEQQISVTLEGNDNVIPFPNLNRKN
jgi:hypothetical protein